MFVSLSACIQDNQKMYGLILMTFLSDTPNSKEQPIKIMCEFQSQFVAKCAAWQIFALSDCFSSSVKKVSSLVS